MRRIVKILIICFLMSSVITSIAYASEQNSIPSLDEVVSGVTNNTTEETASNSKGSKVDVEGNKKSVLDMLEKSVDLSEENEQATKAGAVIEQIAGLVVQILSYVLTAGLTVRVVADLIYIGLPFTREILAKGQTGTPTGGYNQYNSMNSFGGYNSGLNSFGSGYSSFGSSPMRSMGMGMQSQPGGLIKGRLQIVSKAAINAVASEDAPGPNGEHRSAFKIYSKDMIIVLVATPILLTLAMTGILAKLGFAIGKVLVGAVTKLISSILR